MDGKVAIVTWAAMGNGQGVVKVLAKHGATTILADISDQVFATAEQMKQEGLDVHAVQMDVSNKPFLQPWTSLAKLMHW